MTIDQRESKVMELISAYANGIITDGECLVMSDLVLNEISIIGGVDRFDEIFSIECN
tara:strand:- start:35 stop:205 length:171 start_codon:yes stop_codon:yes gene_type:complete